MLWRFGAAPPALTSLKPSELLWLFGGLSALFLQNSNFSRRLKSWKPPSSSFSNSHASASQLISSHVKTSRMCVQELAMSVTASHRAAGQCIHVATALGNLFKWLVALKLHVKMSDHIRTARICRVAREFRLGFTDWRLRARIHPTFAHVGKLLGFRDMRTWGGMFSRCCIVASSSFLKTSDGKRQGIARRNLRHLYLTPKSVNDCKCMTGCRPVLLHPLQLLHRGSPRPHHLLLM